MASESISQVDPQDICEQLANWLALMEHAGVRELVMPGGSDGFESAARALANLARGAAARETDEARTTAVSAAAPGGEGGVPARGSEPSQGNGSPPAHHARGGLGALLGEVGTCRMCELHKGRTNTVFGEGNPRARLMFVGEGPGADEDAQGRPFVGRAGVLLTKIIEAMGLKREDVYIGNVVKCRPPGNRDPQPEEIAACQPYLDRQIALIKPKVIVTLGRYSMARAFPYEKISAIHGKPRKVGEIVYVPMFHPAAALHQPSLRKTVEEDFARLPGILAELNQVEEAAAPPDEPQQLSLF
jgi:uracil-DNA glycosylase